MKMLSKWFWFLLLKQLKQTLHSQKRSNGIFDKNWKRGQKIVKKNISKSNCRLFEGSLRKKFWSSLHSEKKRKNLKQLLKPVFQEILRQGTHKSKNIQFLRYPLEWQLIQDLHIYRNNKKEDIWELEEDECFSTENNLKNNENRFCWHHLEY